MRHTAHTVVIAGASAGVGRAIAREYAGSGTNIAILARGESGLAGVADDIRARGGNPLALPVDMADADAVFDVARRIEDEFGDIDVWINVAMTGVFAPFHEVEPAEYRRVTEVTYLGFVYGSMAALHHMRKRNRGVLVQLGSALAYRGIPLQSAYCGAKHAIQGFTESLRCELLHQKSGMHVTMVQLPALNTPQFSWLRSRLPHHPQPMPPIYQPELAARAVVYAAEHPYRREYWVGMSTVLTLLANAFAPGLLDRYLARTGYGAQQNESVDERQEADNLHGAVDRADGHDYGAHGVFTPDSYTRSPQMWLSHHHGFLAVASGITLGGLAVLRRIRRSRSVAA